MHSKNIEIVIAHPTERTPSGEPFDAATELSAWTVEIAPAVEAPAEPVFVLDGEPHGFEETEAVIENVGPGDYKIRVKWFDQYGQESSGLVFDASVPFPDPPANGTLISVTVVDPDETT